MAPINRNSISLYEDAKATFISLLQHTAQVGAGLIIMLLLTGGNPPGFIMGLSFFLGVAFVAWSEKKRLDKFNKSCEVIKLNKLTSSNYSKNPFWDRFYQIYSLITIALFFIASFLTALLLANFGVSSSLFLLSATLNFLSLIIYTLNWFNKRSLSGKDLSGANLSGKDLSGVNLSSTNLVGANLSGTSLNNAKVQNAKFGYNQGISESMRQELIARGAIFIDSLNDYGQTPTSTE